MKKKLIGYIKKNKLIQKGDTIVIGVSGGADSVCLLLLLNDIKKEWDLNLYVVHVHHGIRGKEADRDAAFVQQLAEQLELPFSLVKKDIPSLAKEWGKTEEETGRCVRYEIFQDYVKKMGGGRIAVAHHRDDQAETVLFQLFRGSGARGMAGMAPKRDNIIRPLLFASRQEILSFLEENGISYCVDSTNESSEYARNVVRNEILPLAEKKINRQSAAHIAAAAEKVAAWRGYVEKMGQEAWKRVCKGDGTLDILKFQQEEPVMQDEILRQVVERWIPGAKDVGEVHYGMVKSMLQSGTGRRVQLPGGMVAEREYNDLKFYRVEETPAFQNTEVLEENPVIYEKGIIQGKKYMEYQGTKISLSVSRREDLPVKIPEKDYTKWFDYDMIKDVLVLRNPAEGDYFTLDSGGKKKLSRYYMDCKLPRSQRDRQLVLAEHHHVLWAMPRRISAAYKITKETKMVLVVTIERD
ncbi:MAG: tRNA lysidine(34) synthetase TilS [Eubacterium sp.]|nr:tRNA lysidine(34) synthetase TilS [Eubacterium sp.]